MYVSIYMLYVICMLFICTIYTIKNISTLKKAKNAWKKCEKKQENAQKYVPITLFADTTTILAVTRMITSNSLVLAKIWLLCVTCASECYAAVMKLAISIIDCIVVFSWLRRKNRNPIKMIHLGTKYNEKEQVWRNQIIDRCRCKPENWVSSFALDLNVSFLQNSRVLDLVCLHLHGRHFQVNNEWILHHSLGYSKLLPFRKLLLCCLASTTTTTTFTLFFSLVYLVR